MVHADGMLSSITEKLLVFLGPNDMPVQIQCLFDTCMCIKPLLCFRWEFKTDGYDVGFGVKLMKAQGKPEVLLPIERVNSHMVPEDGTFTCPQVGTCTFQ